MSDNIKGQQDFTTDSSEFNATAFQIAQAVRRINTAEPVRVVSVQPGAVGPVGMVSVQPLVNLVTGMGDGMTQSELFSLPYLRVQVPSTPCVTPRASNPTVMAVRPTPEAPGCTARGTVSTSAVS